MIGAARIVILVSGLAVLALGVWLAVAEGLTGIGLLTGAGGVLLMLAVAIERMRYSGLTADRRAETVGGPGGDQGDSLEQRFRRTDEVFIDPTTTHRMRVYIDPTTGERRYVQEA
jgi:hypothetical protein